VQQPRNGSGIKNGNLATAVSRVEFVAGTGDFVTLDRKTNAEKFYGAAVNLGGIGIVTKLTLDIEKTYSVRQDVFQNLALDQLKGHFDEIMSSGYSVSLFTDWQSGSISQIWIKRRVVNGVGKSAGRIIRSDCGNQSSPPSSGCYNGKSH